MEKISVIVPCYNKLGLTEDFVRLMNTTVDGPIEFVMIDNHSLDGTAEYLKGLGDPFVYHLNSENIGMVRAFNQGADSTDSDMLVFMHNDVFLHLPEWPKVLRSLFSEMKDAGVVGLYGAKRIRRDGSFMGRSIEHAKAGGSSLREPCTEVAVLDGLFMAMTRTAYRAVGGFDEEYSVHFYDKDISMRAKKAGYRNYVLNIPFTHRGAGTRSSVNAAEDNRLRESMKLLFLQKWHGALPCDVRSLPERIGDLLRKYA
jgi:GT2 family glycosyltransferase